MRAVTLSCAFVACLLATGSVAAQPLDPTVLWVRTAGAGAVAFSPDGQYVASGGLQTRNPFSFGRVDVWATADGTQLGHAETHGTTGLIGYTGDVAFSPDGATLTSANGTAYCAPNGGCSPDRPGLFNWTVPELASVVGRVDLSPASGVSYAPDGSTLAVSYFYDNQGLVRTHDASTLATLLELPGHAYSANDVAYSPDGTHIASVGDDGYLRLWNAQSGALVRAMFHGSYLEGGNPISVTYSPDGQLVASSGDGYNLRTKIWQASDGALVHDLDASLAPASYGTVVVSFTPNGTYLVGGLQQYVPGDQWRGQLRFWNASTGEIALAYAETGPPPYFGGVTSLAFSPAQNNLFAYTVAGQVKVASTQLALSVSAVTSVPPGSTEFRLGAAYPNPFKTRAQLTFQVTKTQRVKAELFDVLGRRVARLFEGSVRAGAPQVLAVDAAGLPTGRYVVRLRGQHFLAARNITLVR